MGVNPVAMLELSVEPVELYRIADRLTANLRLTELMQQYDDELAAEVSGLPLSEATAHRSERNDWKWKPHWIPGKHSEMWCEGPIGTLYLYRKLAELSWWWCRWRPFLTEPRVRTPLLEATRLIAAELNDSKITPILFVPDSLYAEASACGEQDSSMPELLSLMRSRFGPPALSFEAIATEDGESKGYFVENGDKS